MASRKENQSLLQRNIWKTQKHEKLYHDSQPQQFRIGNTLVTGGIDYNPNCNKILTGQRWQRVSYLEITGKLVGKEDESILPMSLADGPPIVLLLTALVQLPAWYLCISPDYNQHTALSIKPLHVAVLAELLHEKYSLCHFQPKQLRS
jgi:hypothetical protein